MLGAEAAHLWQPHSVTYLLIQRPELLDGLTRWPGKKPLRARMEAMG